MARQGKVPGANWGLISTLHPILWAFRGCADLGGNEMRAAFNAMRIVAWNCNMALHKKCDHLLALRPDIAVIPECANPEVKVAGFVSTSSVWIGDNPHKGLGVFTFGDYRAERSPIYRKDFPIIAPVHVDGPTRFNLLAVWACHHKPNSFDARLGPLRRAIGAYRGFIEELPTIVAGDFNDNAKWRAGKPDNHLLNVSELAALGLRSAYHHDRADKQGTEQESTLYWRRNANRCYHVDHCFVPESWTIAAVTIGRFDARLSDHVPLIVDLAMAH